MEKNPNYVKSCTFSLFYEGSKLIFQVFLNFVKNQNEINRATADGTATSHQGDTKSNSSITSSAATSGRTGDATSTELIAIGGSTVENDDDFDDDLPIQIDVQVSIVGWRI